MNQKQKTSLLPLLTAALFLSLAGNARGEDFLPPAEETPAYQQYLLRAPSEQSKLLYLMGRFRNTEFKVLYDGNTYDSNKAVDFARTYIAKHYKNEQADRWIKIHAYRSPTSNQIIYVKYPNGKRRPVRDLLLDELKVLEELTRKR